MSALRRFRSLLSGSKGVAKQPEEQQSDCIALIQQRDSSMFLNIEKPWGHRIQLQGFTRGEAIELANTLAKALRWNLASNGGCQEFFEALCAHVIRHNKTLLHTERISFNEQLIYRGFGFSTYESVGPRELLSVLTAEADYLVSFFYSRRRANVLTHETFYAKRHVVKPLRVHGTRFLGRESGELRSFNYSSMSRINFSEYEHEHRLQHYFIDVLLNVPAGTNTVSVHRHGELGNFHHYQKQRFDAR